MLVCARSAAWLLAAIAIAMLGVTYVAEARHGDSYSRDLYRAKREDQAQKRGKSSVGPARGEADASERAKADDRGRGSASQTANSKQSSTETTAFGSAVEQMITHCEEQATHLRKASFDGVARAIQPTADQRDALELIRSTATEAANGLAAACPKGLPALLSERLGILSQVLDGIVGSLRALRPILVSFYTSLDDEQKARLAVSSFRAAQPKSDGDSRNSYDSYDRIDPEQDAICGHWIAALRSWPIGEIARGMKLSDQQHAALHEVAAATYRAAGDLQASCPVENPLTPVGHLDAEREEMRALLFGIKAIQPVLADFEDTLNADQKKSLDAMMGSSPKLGALAP